MRIILLGIISIFFISCVDSSKISTTKEELPEQKTISIDTLKQEEEEEISNSIKIQVDKDIPIRSYFKWMDSIVAVHNNTYNYVIDEYDIVHFNPWIIDTLANTDYYYLIDKGIFNEDSQELIALAKDQVLLIPDSLETQRIKSQLSKTHLAMNIPAFKLRIIQEGKELYNFPVRVGKNGKRYLAMATRDVDMRTMPGEGEIVRVNKNPAFINPQNNSRYYSTSRDDGKRTALPAIPWLEPSINGIRIGQLIHPTTNLETLEKTSSNGCIGLRESDAWRVYYYAPLGTKVNFTYELEVEDENGKMITLEDIYPEFGNNKN